MTDTPKSAREIADGIMAEHAPEPTFSSAPEVTARRREAFRDAIASALLAEREGGLEDAAKVADYPAEAVIEGPNIVIRVPISAIPVAFEACPDAPRDDEADALYEVTDAALFAKGIVRYLNDEEEDGTTRIHRMFDSAMIEALEQGEEGVEETAAIRAKKGPG